MSVSLTNSYDKKFRNALRITDGSTQSVFCYGFIEFSIAFYGRVLLDRDEEVTLFKNIK